MFKMLRTALLVACFLFVAAFVSAQVSYLGLDGGFEGTATIDNTTINTVPQASTWTKANATQTIANSTTTVRSGTNSLRVNNTSTTGRRVWSPLISTSSTTGQVTIQYYRYVANSTNSQENQEGTNRSGTESLQGTYDVPTGGTWDKETYTPTSSTYTTIASVIMHRQLGTGGDMFIDDVCVYTGVADGTAPNAPTSPSISQNGTNPSTALDVSWTAASGGVDGGGYIVVRGTSDPTTAPNTNGIYATGNTVASGMTVVYVGTSTSFTDGILSAGTTYYYRVYTFDKAYNYSSPITGNGTTASGCTAPGTQASSVTTSTPTTGGFDINWTAGNGNGTMIVVRQTSQSNTAPSSGTSYTANTVWASAGQIDGNNRVVFRNSGTSVSGISGLSAETQYTITAYEYSTTGDCYNLSSPPTATRYTLSTEPSAYPGSFSSTTCTSNSIDLIFSAASTITNADGYIILQKTGSAPTGSPSDATTYSVGNAIGDGTVAAIISSTSTTSTTISSLSASTNYYFKIFPYNANSGATAQTYNYLTSGTPNSTNFTTLANSASTASDITTDATYNPANATNIVYTTYQSVTVPALASSSVGVHNFILRDGGSSSDADALPTILNAISYTYTGTANTILAAALFTTTNSKIADGTVGANSISFSGLSGASVTASDNGNIQLILRVTFNTTVTDNQKLVFTVSSVTSAGACSSSQFAAANGGAAQSDNSSSDQNRIEVTADRLRFGTQPVNGSINTNLAAFTLRFVDANTNLDFDNNRTVTLTTSGVDMSPTSPSGSITAPHSGIVTFSSVQFTSAPQTGITITGTTTGLSNDNNDVSNTFNISLIVYANNDYRTTGSGTWLSNNASPAIWERYNSGTGTWATSNSPVYSTTNSVYIQNGHTITSGGSFGSSVKLKIMDGGVFVVEHQSTAAGMYVYGGGTLQINHYLEITSGGTFEVEDDGLVNYAYAGSSSNSTGLWQGTEIFHPTSVFTIQDYDHTTATEFIPATTDVSTYTNGSYSACFGYLVIDASISTSTTTFQIIPSGFSRNLTHNDLIFRTAATGNHNIRMSNGSYSTTIGGDINMESTFTTNFSFLNVAGTASITVKGDVVNASALGFRLCSSTSAANITLNVDGNVSVTGTGNLTFNAGSSGSAAPILNLKGDLSVASGALFTNSNSATNGTLNFTGTGDGLTATTTQTISIASTGANENKYVGFHVKSGAYVQLINQDLELGTNGADTVESGGTLDFNFNGTTALSIVPVSGATGTAFRSEDGSTLKITSPFGINTSGSTGNVQVTASNRTFRQTATFWYIGKANQVTGDALTSGGTGKIVYVKLIDNSTTLSLSNDVGISNGPTLDAQGGRLEIQKGIVIGNFTGDFSGSGRLVMSDGTYRISRDGILASNLVPSLDGYTNYDLTGGTVELSGANIDQTLSGGPSYYNLKISGTNTLGTNKKNLSENVTINNNLEITGGSVFDTEGFDVNGNAGLRMDNGRWRMSRFTATPSTIPSITGTATDYDITGGTIELYGTGSTNKQLLRGSFGSSQTVTYYNVEINASAANETIGNVYAQYSFNVSGAMNVNSPAIFGLDADDILKGTGSVTIQTGAGLFYENAYGIKTGTGTSTTDGNIRVTGGRTYNVGTYGFAGTGAMVSGNGLPATVNKLFLLKTAATNQITLTNSVTVSNTLSFTKGILTTGTKKVTIPFGGTVTGASSSTGWVFGNFEKYISAGTSVSKTFETGDATYYAPVNFTFANVFTDNYITVSTSSGDHPNIGSSTVNAGKSVNRYWKTINSGISISTYGVVFNFNNPADLDGAAVGSHNSFIGGNYVSSAWSYPTVGTKTSTSTQLTGLSGFGDFQLGVLQTGVYIWTGAGVNPNWTTAANWVGSTVPPNDCASNINIPGVTVYHTVNTNALIGNLYVSDNAVVTITSDSLSICGTVTGGSSTAASFTGSGKVVLKGSAQQFINGKTSFETLRLYNGAGAQMQTGSSVDIYKVLELPLGEFDVNGRTLKFKSQSPTDYGYLNNFSAGFTGSVSGNVTAELTVIGNNYQHFIGSPVSGTLSKFGANGTSGYVLPLYSAGLCNEARSAANTPYGKVFSWEEDKALSAPGGPCPVYGWRVENNGTATIAAAKGYSVYLTAGTFSITGSPNQNNTYTISSLPNSGYALNTLQHPTGNIYTSGWHLLANPYLAPFDMLTSLGSGANASNFDDLMVWVATGPYSGTYQSLVSGNFNENMLAPFQGVMVHRGNGGSASTPQSSANYQFSKTHLSTPSPLPQFTRLASQQALNINVYGNSFQDVTYVEFNAATTSAFDVGYDSRKMMSKAGQPTIYTILNSEVMSANVNRAIVDVTSIPLHVSPGADGTFTIDIDGISSFDATSYVYLEDKVTGTYQNIRDDNTYVFTMNEVDDPDRFVVHFTPAMEIETANSTCQTAGTITLTQPGTAEWNYVVSSGNTVVSSGVLNSTSTAIISVDAGTYTLTMADNNGYTVIKSIQVYGVQNLSAGISVSSAIAETGEDITFHNTGSAATDIVWDFGDGTVISGVSNPEYSYSEPGVYTVTLTVVNADGCSAVVNQQITITESTVSSLTNPVAEYGIVMWGSGNKVYVDFSSVTNTNATVDIFNILGQQLGSDKFASSTIYSRAISNFEAGYVVVRVKNDEAIITKKLFITNK